MRMWMVDPRGMCNKHLVGEHLELHMFVESLRKKMNLGGYFRSNCLEPGRNLLFDSKGMGALNG